MKSLTKRGRFVQQAVGANGKLVDDRKAGPQRAALLRWRMLAEDIRRVDFELTVEDFANILSAYHECDRLEIPVDAMAEALILCLEREATNTDDDSDSDDADDFLDLEDSDDDVSEDDSFDVGHFDPDKPAVTTFVHTPIRLVEDTDATGDTRLSFPRGGAA